MSSIRKFRDLASRLYRLTHFVRHNPDEAPKEFDAMLDSIAEILELTERVKADASVLSTVADHTMADLAFGYPKFRTFFGDSGPGPVPGPAPKAEAEAEPAEEDRGPCLVIHKSPNIKVTKVGDLGEEPYRTTSGIDRPYEPAYEKTYQGTPLESLFRQFPTYNDEDEGVDEAVDHESIYSEDVGAEVDEMIPMEHEGKSYLRGSTSFRVFEKDDRGLPGACVGVWMFQQFVPLSAKATEPAKDAKAVETAKDAEAAIPAVLVEKVDV